MNVHSVHLIYVFYLCSRIHEMFEKMSKGEYDDTLIEKICCRHYKSSIVKHALHKEHKEGS